MQKSHEEMQNEEFGKDSRLVVVDAKPEIKTQRKNNRFEDLTKMKFEQQEEQKVVRTRDVISADNFEGLDLDDRLK